MSYDGCYDLEPGNQAQYESSLDKEEYQTWHDTRNVHSINSEQTMPNVNEMLQSKYLKKEDIDEEMLVTIASVAKVNIAKETEKAQWKFAMAFEELAKPLLLNSTNIKLAAKACNSLESEEWIGQRVILYVDENISFGNDIVGGLRIRGVKRKAATIAQRRSIEDEDLPVE